MSTDTGSKPSAIAGPMCRLGADSSAAHTTTATHDQGSITIIVVVFFIALLAAAGLVVDGGAKLRAARQASAIAEEAARAGAGRVNRDQAYAHGGVFIIDRMSAVAAARAYLHSCGVAGSVEVSGSRSIRVAVTVAKPTVLLSLIGVRHVRVTEKADADLLQGVRAPLGG